MKELRYVEYSAFPNFVAPTPNYIPFCASKTCLGHSCDYVYIVTDDSKKRKDLTDKIMDEYGLFCYSDSFGLGYVYQVFKEPKNIIK